MSCEVVNSCLVLFGGTLAIFIRQACAYVWCIRQPSHCVSPKQMFSLCLKFYEIDIDIKWESFLPVDSQAICDP